MKNRKANSFSVLAVFFLALFVCGVGSYNQLNALTSFRLSMVEIIIGAVCLMTSILAYEHGKLSSKGLLKWMLPVLVIVVSGFIGTFASDYFIYFIIFVLYIQWGANKNEEFELFFRILLFFGIVVSVSVYVDYFNPSAIQNLYSLYPSTVSSILNILRNNNYTSGITIQPAYAAMYIVIAIGVTAYYKDIRKSIKYTLLVLLYISLLLTGKRTSSVAILAAVILVYLIENRGSNQRVIKLLRVLLIVYALYLGLNVYSHFAPNDNGISRFFLLFEKIAAGESILSQRADLWQLSLNEFYKEPLFGAGWGTISLLTETWSGTVFSLTTHNIYIQLLAENGIIGAILFLTPFIVEYIRNIKCLNYQAIEGNDIQLLRLSVFWQSFFFIYGFTGNPIYDLCPLCVFCVTVIIGKNIRNKAN